MAKLQLLRHSKEARLQTSPAAVGRVWGLQLTEASTYL